MKAAQINGYDGPRGVTLNPDAPRPTPAAGQVLVEVHAAGLNPFDYKVTEGNARQMAELHFPATLGGDLAGVIVELGEGVSEFAIGDEVFGQAGALSGNGSFAEFTPIKAAQLAKKPTSADYITSAALPLVASSAYQALIEHAKLQPGQKILIHGGAGGIGALAIQIAKKIGAHVVTTADTDSIPFVRQQGADEVIDYTKEQFETRVTDCDVVYDTVGGDTFTKSYQVLKPGGVLVSMVGQPDTELEGQYNVRTISQFTQVTTDKLAKIAAMVDANTLKVTIDKIFPLDQAGDALAYLKTGKHHGKVVLRIR